MNDHVETKVVAIVQRPTDGVLLVCEGDNSTSGANARPLRSSIGFGERAVEALKREMHDDQPLVGRRRQEPPEISLCVNSASVDMNTAT
jgi:hypothetical protein